MHIARHRDGAGILCALVVRVARVGGLKDIGPGLVGEERRERAVAGLGNGHTLAGGNDFCGCIRSDGELNRTAANKRSRFSGDVDGGGGLIDNQRSSDSGTRIIIISLRRSQADLDGTRLSNGQDIALKCSCTCILICILNQCISGATGIGINIEQIAYIIGSTKGVMDVLFHGICHSGLGDGHIDRVAGPNQCVVVLCRNLNRIVAAIALRIKRQAISSAEDLLAVLHPCVEPVCARLLHRQGNGAVGVVGCTDFAIFCRGVRGQCNIVALRPLDIVSLSSYRLPCNRASSTDFIVIL